MVDWPVIIVAFIVVPGFMIAKISSEHTRAVDQRWAQKAQAVRDSGALVPNDQWQAQSQRARRVLTTDRVCTYRAQVKTPGARCDNCGAPTP